MSDYLYRYVSPEEANSLFKRQSLSYSRPTDFPDKNEFSAKRTEYNVDDLLAYAKWGLDDAKQQNCTSTPIYTPCHIQYMKDVLSSKDVYNEYVKEQEGLAVKISIREYLNGAIRVCCLTRLKENEKMWEEYAASSKGLKMKLDKGRFLAVSRLRNINYTDKLPEFNLTMLRFGNEPMLSIVSTKLVDYKDEDEVRFFAYTDFIEKYPEFYFEKKEKNGHVYLYEKKLWLYLESVTFGKNATDIFKHRMIKAIKELNKVRKKESPSLNPITYENI